MHNLLSELLAINFRAYFTEGRIKKHYSTLMSFYFFLQRVKELSNTLRNAASAYDCVLYELRPPFSKFSCHFIVLFKHQI